MNKYVIVFPLCLILAGCTAQKNGNPSLSNSTGKINSVESTNNVDVYDLTQVASASNKEKCWSIINNNVYDLTSYIDKHPNGPKDILAICGKDGTNLFDSQHIGNRKVENILSQYKIGTFKK
ncbi:MAG: cytochrome b5-like heme/steroid binding domain-containing protein [Candidatus Magasanikbacteria bacterium]